MKSRTQTIGQRLEGSHPLAIYWAIDPDGSPGLVIKDVPCASIPENIPKPRGLRIRIDASEQPSTTVSLFLQQVEDRDVFHKLILDVVEFSATSDVPAAVNRIFHRLRRWQALLGFARGKEMSEEEVRGLLAELWVLEHRIEPSLGLVGAIRSWAAPRRTPQDFALPGGLIEVKARLAGSRQEIRISSLEQLDPGPSPLHLLIVELTTSEAGEGTISLNETILSLMQWAQENSEELASELQLALQDRGYVVSPEYDRMNYRITGTRAFEVLETFPALRRSAIDQSILEASYSLGLPSIATFERTFESVIQRTCSARDLP